MSRIIAGSAKGRRIETPKGERTRPTTDRTREALFSALASWFGTADEAADEHLAGVAVLDLYAGSGAIGLEALSRGASRAVGVEADPPTADLIRANARKTRLLLDVVTGRLPGALAKARGPFDLVYADPPYEIADPQVDALLAGIVEAELLAEKALVIIERPRRSATPDWPDVFTDQWLKEYGDATLHFGATD